MYFVTERAVFRLTENGPELIEIAKGIDLERDVLAHMDFRPLIAADLKETPVNIYREEPFGLAESIRRNSI